VEKVKKTLPVKKVNDQHEVDALGGKCLQHKHSLYSGLSEWKKTILVIQL
jgi:hypothetical protein